MKVVTLLATLLVYSLAILDRSYYDALCTHITIQNCQLAQASKISDRPFVGCRRNIIQIATQAQGNVSRRST